MITYYDIKCEFCEGHGEREINVDGMDCPQTCSFCEGTGVDPDQLLKMVSELKSWNSNQSEIRKNLMNDFLNK